MRGLARWAGHLLMLALLSLQRHRAAAQVQSADGMFLLGSFTVRDGPSVAIGNYPTAYSCIEACAYIFSASLSAGGYLGFAGSTSSTEVTNTCNGDVRMGPRPPPPKTCHSPLDSKPRP
jgi:hypothetical protein